MEELHLFILGVTVIGILWADHEGLWYMLGKKQVLNKARTKYLHYAVGAGLTGMIGTGIIMAWPGRAYYISLPEFQLKMAFVLALVLNSFFIGKIMHIATETPFAALSRKQQYTLVASGVASALGWIGAAAVGFFFL